jgi:nitrate reductase NapD
MHAELHISSLVVHAKPAVLDAVCRAIGALGGAEVHASNAQGKIVVTLETANEGDVLARLEQIGRLDGVISAALVYHHVESASLAQTAGSVT